ncbi:MAG: lytic transglycosylase [Thiothrix sp.]|nr:lytic transglycosylase [Thiothrix sp.]HPQ95135.1 lytic transglycosylase [Thiolinea sp.]
MKTGMIYRVGLSALILTLGVSFSAMAEAASGKRYSGRTCDQHSPETLHLKAGPYHKVIEAASTRFGVDENLVKAVITAETCFRPMAVSPKGAAGLMQLMPATARRFGVTNRYNVTQNIFAGTYYLRWLLNRYNGSVRHAVAAYNSGEGTVDRYGAGVPYRETRRYVVQVLNAFSKLRAKAELSNVYSASPERRASPQAYNIMALEKRRLDQLAIQQDRVLASKRREAEQQAQRQVRVYNQQMQQYNQKMQNYRQQLLVYQRQLQLYQQQVQQQQLAQQQGGLQYASFVQGVDENLQNFQSASYIQQAVQDAVEQVGDEIAALDGSAAAGVQMAAGGSADDRPVSKRDKDKDQGKDRKSARSTLAACKTISRKLRKATSQSDRKGVRTFYFRVGRGDTLGEIGEKTGVSLRELRKLNGMSGSRIQRGERLKVAQCRL